MSVLPKTGEGFLAVSRGAGISVGRERCQESQKLGGFCLCASTPQPPNSLPLPCFFTPAAQLLYQEYSDVFLNKEIQSQQRLDSLTEAPGPASPQQPRKALVSSESYLKRLSMASSGSLWQEIPVVRNSAVLLSMTHEDQKLQEVLSRARWGRGRGYGRGSKALSSLSPTPLRHHERAVPTTYSPHTHAPRDSESSPLNCFLNVTALPPLYLLMPLLINSSLLLV